MKRQLLAKKQGFHKQLSLKDINDAESLSSCSDQQVSEISLAIRNIQDDNIVKITVAENSTIELLAERLRRIIKTDAHIKIGVSKGIQISWQDPAKTVRVLKNKKIVYE